MVKRMRFPGEHVSEMEALLVSCPMCKQGVGAGCVYMPLVMADAYSKYPAVRARLALVGTPTKKAHNERRNEYRKKLWNKQRTESHRKQPIEKLDEEVLAAYRAGVEFDRREFIKLYSWLMNFGSILYEK